MKRACVVLVAALALGFLLGGASLTRAADLGLVQRLVQTLGVTEQQASGGAGAMFNLARQNMGAGDFTTVAEAVPGIDRMMASAPAKQEASGSLGGVSSLLGAKASSLMGGSASSLTGAVELADSFSKLGMKAGMIQAFTPIVLNYVKEKGGEPLMLLLQSALQ
jgi:alkyl sulfatase BDS1-like metallo-beta-lactamase superfamily hydrolase